MGVTGDAFLRRIWLHRFCIGNQKLKKQIYIDFDQVNRQASSNTI